MLFRNTLLAKLVRFTCLSPPFITKDDFVYKQDAQVFITSSLLLLYTFLNHPACITAFLFTATVVTSPPPTQKTTGHQLRWIYTSSEFDLCPQSMVCVGSKIQEQDC